MKQQSPWLTLFRYLYSIIIGAVIVQVIFTNHDFSLWRVGLAAIAIVVGAVVHVVLELAVREAMGE
jgi:uncharacterized membrane protein YcaP (DUF421 family)